MARWRDGMDSKFMMEDSVGRARASQNRRRCHSLGMAAPWGSFGAQLGKYARGRRAGAAWQRGQI